MAGQTDSTLSYIALGVGAVPAYDPVVAEYAEDGNAKTVLTPIGGWIKTIGSAALPFTQWRYISMYSWLLPSGSRENQAVDQGFVPEYNKLNIRTSADIKYSDMKELDFEVIRVPITESGVEYVKSTGNNKYFTDIVLTATVPSFDRYKFTEIGVYSAQSNSASSTKPSQLLFRFSPEENWSGVDTDTKTQDSDLVTNETAYYPYDNKNFAYFSSALVSQLYAEPRVGSWCVSLSGEVSNSVESFGFGSVRPDDEFRLAYFLNTAGNLSGKNITKSAKITFTDRAGKTASGDFATNEKMFAGDNDLIPSHADFGQKYGVGVIAAKDLTVETGFSWADVRIVKLEEATPPPTDPPGTPQPPAIFVDALRFVSTNHNNPNYGLIAYSVVQNRNGSAPDNFEFNDVNGGTLDGIFNSFVIPEPIVKQKGLETLIQYRIRVSESLNGEDYVAF